MAATDGEHQPAPAGTVPSPVPEYYLSKREPDAEADLAPLDPPAKAARPDADEEAAAAVEAKARAAVKGKGKMVVEEEEDGGDEKSSNDEDDDEDEVEGGERRDGDDSDDGFCEDPLTEVDLNSILPSRTRRRAPPQPGAYLVRLEEAAEDDEDADEDTDIDMARDQEDGDGEEDSD
ncbi:hypothetical protein ABZP36_007075 [Zizania latifolia]